MTWGTESARCPGARLEGIAVRSSLAVPRRGGLRRREAIAGFVFISPWIIGFLVFALGPMIYSLYLSLTQYAIVREPGIHRDHQLRDRVYEGSPVLSGSREDRLLRGRRGDTWSYGFAVSGAAAGPEPARHLHSAHVLFHNAIAYPNSGVCAHLGLDPSSPAWRLQLPLLRQIGIGAPAG